MKNKFCMIFLAVLWGGLFVFPACGNEKKPNPDDNNNLSGTTIEIVKDAAFKNGFGASWNFGTAFTGTDFNKKNEQLANTLKKGYCRDYEEIRDPVFGTYKSLYLLPGGKMWEDVMPRDEDNMYWGFEEGYHKNFTDYYGNKVDELQAHKLTVNNKIVQDTKDSLLIEQYNNYGLAKTDATYDTKLVKRIESDRKGRIKTFYDTSKEIRNVAYKYNSEFAFDTWPHLYMQHNLKEDFNMALFSKIAVKLKIKVNLAEQINTWPQGESDIPGQETVTETAISQSAIGINSYFLLREISNPAANCMFVGHNLFATSEELKRPIITTEQYGNVFYRESVDAYSSTKAPPVVGEDFIEVSFDLVKLVENCIDALQGTEFPTKNTKLSDWQLSFYQIGFENMGNWKGEYELKDLSVVGTYL